ncbi:hypothetical protein ACJX0J_037420 [Zea mays]
MPPFPLYINQVHVTKLVLQKLAAGTMFAQEFAWESCFPPRFAGDKNPRRANIMKVHIPSRCPFDITGILPPLEEGSLVFMVQHFKTQVIVHIILTGICYAHLINLHPNMTEDRLFEYHLNIVIRGEGIIDLIVLPYFGFLDATLIKEWFWLGHKPFLGYLCRAMFWYCLSIYDNWVVIL